MNTNKYFKLGLITMFLAFFGQLSFAQEVIVADTIPDFVTQKTYIL